MLRRILEFFGLALRRDLDELIALAEINVDAGRIILGIVESQRQQIALLTATSDTPKQ